LAEEWWGLGVKTKIIAFLLLSIALLTANASAVAPTIHDFNLSMDIKYSTSRTVDINVLVSNAPDGWCVSETSTTGGSCTPYSSLVQHTFSADGNKFLYLYAKNGTEYSSADDSIIIDITNPETTAKYNGSTDFNSEKWFKENIDINFFCSDASSGCSKIQYRVDSIASDSVTMGAWQDGNSFKSSTYFFTEDGNFGIDFNSLDGAGNTETTNRIYFLRDFSGLPTITIIQPTQGSTLTNSQWVIFDVNDFHSGADLSTITVDINGNTSDFNTNACTAFDTNLHCEFAESDFDLNGTEYSVAIGAKDRAGNSAASVDANFQYVDSSAPAQLSTPTFSAANQQCTLTWAVAPETDVNAYEFVRSLVSGGGFSDANRVKVVVASSDCSGSQCSSADTNSLSNDVNYYYKIRARDKSGNKGALSAIAGPCKPSGTGLSTVSISASPQSHDSWSNSNDTTFTLSASGADRYTYILDTSSGTTPSDSNKLTGTSIPYNDLSDGTWYFHARSCTASTCDGTTTHFTLKIDTSTPGTVSGLSASHDSGNNEIDLSWSSVADTSGVTYVIYRGTSSSFGSMSEIATTTSTSYSNSSNLTNGTTYYYRIKSRDGAGNTSGESGYSSAFFSGSTTTGDTTDPTVSWVAPASNATVSGIVELKADASDSGAGMWQLKFYVDGTIPIGTVTGKVGGYYVFDWNSFTVANGSHTLKALALDRAATANTSSVQITVIVDNEGGGPVIIGDKAEAEEAIKEAEDSQDELQELLNELGARGIAVSDAVQDTIDDAVEKLGNAGTQMAGTNYVNAKNLAEAAKTGFEAAKEAVSVESLGEKVYAYNPSTLEILLKGLGLNQALIDEALALGENASVERKFEVVKVTESGQVLYRANVRVIVTNTGNEQMELQVVEFIPKEFAENASQIVSSHSFQILEADPAIAFNVSLEAGETVEILYGLGEELTEDQALALLNENALDRFVAPALLFNKATAINSAVLGITPATGLFGLGGALEGAAYWVGLAIVAIIVIALVVFIAGKLLKEKEDSGFGGMQAYESGESVGERLKAGFGGLFSGKEEKEQGPKWAYKE